VSLLDIFIRFKNLIHALTGSCMTFQFFMIIQINESSAQPKAMTAFLSGEMRDTVAISPAGAYGES
jgi:hypothetical protein